MATIGWFVLILFAGALCAGLLYRLIVRGDGHTRIEYFLWLLGSSALLVACLFLTFHETVAPLYADILSASPSLDPAGAVFVVTMTVCWLYVAAVLVAVTLSIEKTRRIRRGPVITGDVGDA